MMSIGMFLSKCSVLCLWACAVKHQLNERYRPQFVVKKNIYVHKQNSFCVPCWFHTCFSLSVPKVTSFRAVVELVSENSRIFSGESLHLRCSIPDVHRSNWSVEWFRGSERLPENGENFHLWNAHIKEAGKFSCQGARKSVVGIIRTMQSLPVEIDVDGKIYWLFIFGKYIEFDQNDNFSPNLCSGGWAILKAPSHPPLVGDTLKLSCRLRGNPPVHETILYRDGIEVMRQSGQNLSFYLSNVTLEDAGMYSCRVSWDARRRTYSVISVNTMVNILGEFIKHHRQHWTSTWLKQLESSKTHLF